MVIVVTTTYFPSEKCADVGKKYLEQVKKFPLDRSLEKALVPVAFKTTKDGMKAITVAEIKDGKFKEYMTSAYANILDYFAIQGYRVEIEVYMSGVEALPLVGLKMPEL